MSGGVYPRTRGATFHGAGRRPQGLGLSPHARGNPGNAGITVRWVRSIPARAGQPAGGATWVRKGGVYPRTRGATARAAAEMSKRGGLSPHARGNQCLAGPTRPGPGSIPARAGQPPSFRGSFSISSVYPRTRGATMRTHWLIRCPCGLSPHARGNHPRRRRRPHRHDRGLSPHARGNPACSRRERVPRRSIPARAGQPLYLIPPRALSEVYPRTRGATEKPGASLSVWCGLSPHARGNRLCHCPRTDRGRSIPARAGQPVRVDDSAARRPVYPRTRGATSRRVGTWGA